MYQENYVNIKKNISNFYIWFIPIIIVSKIIRWTIMYNKLVAMSIGNGIADRINRGLYSSFKISMFSDLSGASSVAETNFGWICDHINFFGCTTIVGWEIYLSVIFNFFLLFLVKDFYQRTPLAGTRENIFVYTGVAILNIFCFCLSKEPYQMLFFYLMAFAIKKGKGYQQKGILLAVVLVLTVIFSRKYYGLVLLYYFILQYVVRYLFDNLKMEGYAGKMKLITNILLTAVIIGVCYFFLLSFLSTNNEDTYEEMVAANYRAKWRQGVAASEIYPIFHKGNPILMSIDYVVKIFRLMFPIELLIKGKVTYIFFIFFQAMLALGIGHAFLARKKKVKKIIDEEEEGNAEESGIELPDSSNESLEIEEEEEDADEEEKEQEIKNENDRKDARTVALYLYLAFLLCSAAFEPDFGSWIRHEGITLPILLLLF